MSANAPQPPPTPPDIFERGTPILMIAGPRSQTIEEWVQVIAKMTNTRTDWRMIGGRAIVLTLGDAADCERVLQACISQSEALVDQYMTCPYNFSSRPQRTDVQFSTDV